MKYEKKITLVIKEIMSNEDFRLTYEKDGVNLDKEFYVNKNKEIISSIRFMGRLLGVNSKAIDKLHNIMSKTNKKRIRKKISHRMFSIIQKETY
jgi:hypothetical protein